MNELSEASLVEAITACRDNLSAKPTKLIITKHQYFVWLLKQPKIKRLLRQIAKLEVKKYKATAKRAA